MTLSELANGEPLDVAVIGGGVNGAAIAREAAARGLRVALLEQEDFGFGTSWRSTKLIHGGLRYLEHGDLRLVFESLRERAWLLKTRPHLVQPLRLLLPILPWTRRPAWQLRAGLELYDLLAMYRAVPRHRSLSGDELHRRVPSLAEASSGGFSFFDAQAVAPERLVLELALEAEAMGATILNHARVTGIRLAGGAVAAIEVEQGGECQEIAVRAVVNAAGPWVDAVNRLTGEAPQPLLGVTRGTHIVCEPDGPLPRDAIFSTARSDGRVFFAIPQGHLLRVGTTDVRYDGDAGAVAPTAEEVDYLLSEAAELLPGLAVRREQVRYCYAGLRPLPEVKGGPEAAITRRHSVIRHAREGGPAGMFSIVGGKLSTFRPLAREVAKTLGAGRARSAADEGPGLAAFDLEGLNVPVHVREHLRVYGAASADVVAGGVDVVCAHAGATSGEVTRAVRREHASTLSDIMLRRTGIAWASCRGLCCHRRVAGLAAPLLGWDESAREAQVAAFERDLAKHLPTLDEVGIGNSG